MEINFLPDGHQARCVTTPAEGQTPELLFNWVSFRWKLPLRRISACVLRWWRGVGSEIHLFPWLVGYRLLYTWIKCPFATDTAVWVRLLESATMTVMVRGKSHFWSGFKDGRTSSGSVNLHKFEFIIRDKLRSLVWNQLDIFKRYQI